MEFEKLKLANFLKRNRISKTDWDTANIKFDDLKAIGECHIGDTPLLNETAELLAKILQKCDQVHSVRWRVKDPEHLMEKIVRKRNENTKKYKTISKSSYFQIVTDLVGVRVLHLFKDDWKNIDRYIKKNWKPIEVPIAYIRPGDEKTMVSSYEKSGCEVREHPAGYRSIHYVTSTQPTKRKVFSEIQVRTIFEEGWSEIDHKVRYPKLSSNELVSYFLTIFNRMSGSADEMGSFVKNLKKALEIQEKALVKKNNLLEKYLTKIENLVSELAKAQKQAITKDATIDELEDVVAKLRKNSTLISGDTIAFGGIADLLKNTELINIGGTIASNLNLQNILGTGVPYISAEHLANNDLSNIFDSTLDALNLPDTLPGKIQLVDDVENNDLIEGDGTNDDKSEK